MHDPSTATPTGRRAPADADAAVTGVFRDPAAATRAVRRLTAKSVPVDSIRVHLVDERGRPSRELEVEDEAGALKGGSIGAAVGGAVGLLVVILVPVLGGVDAGSALGIATLLGSLRAIALCAAAGVPLGVLLGMGRWEGRKKISDAGGRFDRIHVAVESDALADVAREVLEEAGAERVDARAGRPA